MDTISIVTTVKAPLNIIEEFVSYHTNIGVDRIFLFFDDPHDEAIGEVEKMETVECIRCDESYWARSGSHNFSYIESRQRHNANIGLVFAKEEGLDWLIHIDIDELIYAKDGLSRTLSGLEPETKAVRLKVLEALVDEYTYSSFFREVKYFRVYDPIRERLAKVLGVRKAFFDGQYFRGYRWGKSAIRVACNYRDVGIHKPTLVNGTRLFPDKVEGLNILHFDTCGIEAFEAKWEKRLNGSGKATEMDSFRKAQYEYYKDLKLKGGDINTLYRRLTHIPHFEKRILKLIGLIKKIDLDDQYF